jgi:hypothetical protein
MGFHTPMRLTPSTAVAASTSPVTAIPPSAMTTTAALLAAANAYVAAATLPFGAMLAWIVPGLFLTAVRTWRPLQALLFGCAYGVVVGLGLGVAEGSTVDVLLGSLLAVERGPALLSAALPFGLVAYAYAALAQPMPASARGSFAAWLWPGAEVLRRVMAPEANWVDLGATQSLTEVLRLGSGSPYVMSFVMVLVSCTITELIHDRSNLRLEARSAVRWVALPALAMLALYVNLSTAVTSAGAVQATTVTTIERSQLAVPLRGERRVTDRPVLTAGAILTAI